MQETQKTQVWSLGQEDPLEEGMPTHFSILAWSIPWAEETGGLQSIGSQRVGHDWACKQSALWCVNWVLIPPIPSVYTVSSLLLSLVQVSRQGFPSAFPWEGTLSMALAWFHTSVLLDMLSQATSFSSWPGHSATPNFQAPLYCWLLGISLSSEFRFVWNGR